MGASFCGFRCRPSPSRSSEKVSENENCGLTASVMKFMKPRSLWAVVKVKRRLVRLPEKQEMQLHKNNCKVLTLEDWIISSPGLNRPDYINNSGGETPVHKQSSNKIHPSFDGDLKGELLHGDGFSHVEISVSTGEAKTGQLESGSTSLCRTKSGKTKKKVSFRSPEVANVFVLDHSPEIYMRDNE